MIIINLVLFLVFLFVLVKSAEYATDYSTKLARRLHLTEFIVSFFIVSIVSASPEGTIAILSAFNGQSSLGLGTLLGSNVADLTLVFGILALISSGGVTIKSEMLRKDFFYLALLLLPLILGFDGKFSRIDGAVFIIAGVLFFFSLILQSPSFRAELKNIKYQHSFFNIVLLVISVVVLVLSAHFAIEFGTGLANDLKIPPILIGLTIISLGTCLPELIFSIKSVKSGHTELALGDILGTVIIDTTILLGVMILINPFTFDKSIIYITAGAMFLAGLLTTVLLLNTNNVLTKKEGLYLLLFYLLYIMTEFIINHAF